MTKKILKAQKTDDAKAIGTSSLFAPIKKSSMNRHQRRQEQKVLRNLTQNDLSLVSLDSLVYLVPRMFNATLKYSIAMGVDAVLASAKEDGHPLVNRLISEAAWNSRNKHYLVEPKSDRDNGKRLHISVNLSGDNGQQIEPGYEFDDESEEERDFLSIIIHYTGHQRLSITIPLKYILKSFKLSLREHHAYAHSLIINSCEHNNLPCEKYIYYGVTKRTWTTRLQEHMAGILKNSVKKFHSKVYSSIHQTEYCFLLNFELVDVGYDLEGVMNWEEWAVDNADPIDFVRLNVLPGGYKGLKFLHKLKLIGVDKKVSLDEREEAIEKYCQISPRFNSWQDNDAYRKRVFSRKNTLDSPEQVNEVRWLYHEKKLTRHDIDDMTGIGYERICRIIREQNYPAHRINDSQ